MYTCEEDSETSHVLYRFGHLRLPQQTSLSNWPIVSTNGYAVVAGSTYDLYL